MPVSPSKSHSGVASPHHLASITGRAILAEGGNAIEAMVAMAATIAVVYPHMNGMGGDGFWLIRDAKGTVRVIEACGYAGSLATITHYNEKGYESLPARGPDAALTVAGAVGGWIKALDIAKALGGRLPLSVLLSEALHYAREGYAISRSEAKGTPKEWEALKTAPHFAAHFLHDDIIPQQGTLRKAPALADMLDYLGKVGLYDFYRGDIGTSIAADLARLNSPVTREDLHIYEAQLRAPLTTRFQDIQLYNAPPPSQGLASLMILGQFAHLNVTKGESLMHHHSLIEATKRAFMVRDQVVTDFDHVAEDVSSYLTATALAREASLIDQGRAASSLAAVQEGDTIWMGAIDAQGLAVSYIQSIYWEYGSGCVLPQTGLLWQNRGTSFSLNAKALNPLQPRRKPFHTLNPALAVFKDGRVLSYGTMGGDGQPQFQAQIFTRYACFGMGIREAVEAPRWLFGRTWGDASHNLKLEKRFDDTLIKELEKRGHQAELKPDYCETLGHAGMVVQHDKGEVEAVHDPRSDAEGWFS
jgi:oxamate amidohydrolase